MDKFTTQMNGKEITVSQVKGQPYLFNISINTRFAGYIDTTEAVSMSESSNVSSEEENALRALIKEALQ
ncbi:hypothetical protein [Pedobacter sp. WC2423]|uniref:hypothetical protein n=1 Tax=Pedobacter sp. WC2423 TaxID=3234142 RepID=UPI00346767DC